jgi:hypothetical protein
VIKIIINSITKQGGNEIRSEKYLLKPFNTKAVKRYNCLLKISFSHVSKQTLLYLESTQDVKMDSKFEILVPEIATGQFPFSITGSDSQVLSVSLNSEQRLECEPGSMMMMSSDIHTTVECGSCSRLCTGEGLCKVIYTNKGSAPG